MLATDRPGYVHGGTLTEFRLDTTDELLWEASLRFLPVVDDVLYYAIGQGSLTDYEVEEVKFEFRKMTQDDWQGNPQEVVTGLSDCKPIVIVKVAS